MPKAATLAQSARLKKLIGQQEQLGRKILADFRLHVKLSEQIRLEETRIRKAATIDELAHNMTRRKKGRRA